MEALLIGILSSYIASALFGRTTSMLDHIRGNKSLEEKLTIAFENAVDRYFQGDIQRKKVKRSETSNAVNTIKAKWQGQTIDVESEQYKGLYKLFQEEIAKDTALANYAELQELSNTQDLIKKSEQEIEEIVRNYGEKIVSQNTAIKDNSDKALDGLGELKQMMDQMMSQRMPHPDCEVSFAGAKHTTIFPQYIRRHYVPKPVPKPATPISTKPYICMSAIELTTAMLDDQIAKAMAVPENTVSVRSYTMATDMSLCPIQFSVKNVGDCPMESLMVTIRAVEDGVVFERTNQKGIMGPIAVFDNNYTLTKENAIKSRRDILLVDDVYELDDVYIGVPHDRDEVTLIWVVASMQHRQAQRGELVVMVKPTIEMEDVQLNEKVGEPDVIVPLKIYE